MKSLIALQRIAISEGHNGTSQFLGNPKALEFIHF